MDWHRKVNPVRGIYRLFDGNQWTPQQLADAMRDAARSSAP